MTKNTYINTMPYAYDANKPGSKYRPCYQENYKNKGETAESIAKFHRGLYTEVNPATMWSNGSDIPSEGASVKSSEGSLGRSIGEKDWTVSQKIKFYFRTVPSTRFIWVEWDQETETVTEYIMDKREFGAFVARFTRICHNSAHTDVAIRFRKTSNKMIEWLEAQCA